MRDSAQSESSQHLDDNHASYYNTAQHDLYDLRPLSQALFDAEHRLLVRLKNGQLRDERDYGRQVVHLADRIVKRTATFERGQAIEVDPGEDAAWWVTNFALNQDFYSEDEYLRIPAVAEYRRLAQNSSTAQTHCGVSVMPTSYGLHL